MVPISSKDDLMKAWAFRVGYDSTGNSVPIDATVLFMHGGDNRFNFKDENDKFNILRFYDSDIQDLRPKEMAALISLACNSGQPGKSNIASTFLYDTDQQINKIIASDGSTYWNGVRTESTGHLWWKKTTSPVSFYTQADVENPNALGFKLYQNDGNSQPGYLGGVGYNFSLTELIKMANSYK